MANKTTFKVVSPTNFNAFIKRFSSIESTLLIEIEEGEMKAKSFTPERAVVKFSKFGLNEAFDHVDGEENIYFGIYNVSQFTGAFKHFTGEFELIIFHEDLDGKRVGTEVILKSLDGKLKINLDCASYRLFKHISDDLFLNQIAAVDGNVRAKFDFDKDQYSQIISLSSIETDEKIIGFENSTEGINVKGRAFEMEVSSGKFDDVSIKVYKNHFNLIDREDSELYIANDKLVCKSKDGNTITVIGETQGDD